MKKKTLTKEEHENLALSLTKAQELLEPWIERFEKAYSVNDERVKMLHSTLVTLSSTLNSKLDSDWYNLPETASEGHNSPYYRPGKSSWM